MERTSRLFLAGILAAVAARAAASSLAEGPAVAGRAIPEVLSGQELRPLSLASADFDGDGTPDLAAGFGTPEGGVVILYRGNADALYPHSPEARQRQAQGRFVGAPFLPTDRVLTLSAPPDFLFAGDFDADGRADLAAMARDGSAVLLARGGGDGAFLEPETTLLAGAITSAAAGDVNRRDGLTDLVVSVDAPSGPRALVLEGSSGALRSAPEAIPLSMAATAIAVGDADGDGYGDFAAIAGGELLVLSGRDRRTAKASGQSITLELEPRAVSIPAAGEGIRLEAAGGERHWLSREKTAEGPRWNWTRREERATPPDAAAALPMRVGRHAGGEVVLASDGGLSIFASATLATFVVDVTSNLADAAAGNGTCADINGDCSLRAALEESNALGGLDTITFNIPGAGVPSIPVGSLPVVTGPVTIDGTTQPAGRVAVTGTSNGTLLNLSGGSSVVRGLVFNGIANYGLRLQSGDNVVEDNFFGTTSDGTGLQGALSLTIVVTSGSNNRIGGPTPAARNIVAGGSFGIRLDGGTTLIQGNYFGTDVTGALDLGPSGAGIHVFSALANTIGGAAPGEGNLASGNNAEGIRLDTAGNLVQGNRVGTDATGALALPNTTFGVHVNFSADNTIGGTAPGAGNLISGNGSTGLQLDASGVTPIVNTLVQGNRIGTNADGTAALPNAGRGIAIVAGTNVMIGGTVAGARNLISGNLQDGIFLTKFLTVYPTDTVIQGNFIGTDATGTVAVPNLQSGIGFEYALGTQVGGPAAGEGNLISGNHDHGIRFGGITDASANPNFVRGNLIGVNAFGTGALGNGQAGAFFASNALGYEIGGAGAGEPNLIAYNAGDGIASASLRKIRSRPNSIHSNGGLGVDRSNDGVSPNQPPGVLVYENSPVLTAASTSASGTSVSGTLTSGYAETFTIHVFSNPTCDPSGYGEARQYLGSTNVSTTVSGDTPFSALFPTPVAGGSYITALATAPDITPYFTATSELSFCRQVGGTPPPGSVPLEIYAAAPSRGGNTGAVTFRVTGQGIVAGASVLLKRAGQADRVATGVVVSPEGASVTGVLPLSGATAGDWDIVVTNPDNTTATLAAAFNIEAGTEPSVWTDILGRGTLTVRVGREQMFFLVYGNTGNVDAPPTEFRVTVPWQLQVMFVDKIQGSKPVVQVARPMLTGGTGETSIGFILPSIPASSSATLAFRVKTAAALGTQVEFRAWHMTTPGLAYVFDEPPDPAVTVTPTILVDTSDLLQANVHVSDGVTSGDISFDMTVAPASFEADPVITKTVDSGVVTYSYSVAFSDGAPPSLSGPRAPADGFVGDVFKSQISSSPETMKMLKDAFPNGIGKEFEAALTNVAGNLSPDTDPVFTQEFIDAVEAAGSLKAIADVLDGLPENARDPGQMSDVQMNKLNDIMAEATMKFKAAQDSVEELSLMNKGSLEDLSDEDKVEKVKETYETCPTTQPLTLSCPSPDVGETRHHVDVLQAFDPNEKAGPSGAGESRYVTGQTPFPYTVTFENLESASAAAQEVVVTDQLDGSKLDLSTFELGPIAFGTHVLDVPPGLTSFTGDIDLRPGIDLIARISADFSLATGLATWHFFSIDPATGQPTQDPVIGFLPPNVSSPEGEGHVTFTIDARSGLATGTEIHNQASIVFDANPAIVTADWFNTIDVTAPTSQVAALPASSCTGILVAWSGTDTHSGIAEYDVLASQDGGPFVLWIQRATSATGTFYGTVGSTYAFYSIARDAAGNEEAPPGGADATTAVGSPSPLVDLLTPSSGPATGAPVALTGSGFEAGASVTVGGSPASGETVTDPTSMSATFPALAAGGLYDVVAANASACSDTFVKGWFADFNDVPASHAFHDFVEKIFRRSVTAGCSGGNYCPDNPVTRAQMAVFLIKAKYNLSLVPPTATGTHFTDVPVGSFAADWIEQLANEGVTGGCGGGNYCPSSSVTRKQMAVFLLKSEHGALYVPPAATGVFPDVPPGDPFAPWIEQLAAEGITGGCGGGNYCPNNPVTRGQMAVFLSKTFGF